MVWVQTKFTILMVTASTIEDQIMCNTQENLMDMDTDKGGACMETLWQTNTKDNLVGEKRVVTEKLNVQVSVKTER
jgi:hypothetical protein